MIFHYFSREFEKIYFYQKGIKFEKNIRILIWNSVPHEDLCLGTD